MSFRLECGTIIEVFFFCCLPIPPVLKGERAVFGKLVGAATNQLMTPCHKDNSNRRVNMSASEPTSTVPRRCTRFQQRHGEKRRGMFVSAVVPFAFGTLLLLTFLLLSRVKDVFIFFVNL